MDTVHFRATLADLQRARDQQDLNLLRNAFNNIVFKPGQKFRDPKLIPGSLLVMVAECGLNLNDYETASASLALYGKSCPPRDQFWCRHLLAKAIIAYQFGSQAKGHALVHSVQKSVEFILEAIRLSTDAAERTKEYGHLVYNATVLYWKVTRCLQRDGYRVHLLKSVQKLIEMLENTSEDERDQMWFIEMYSLATFACFDAGEDRAKEYADKAIDLQVKYFPENVPLQLKLLRYRVHVSAGSADSVLSKPGFKTAVPKSALNLQKLRSAQNGDQAKLQNGLQDCLDMLDKEMKEKEDGSVDPENLYLVAQIGQVAFDAKLYTICHKCMSRALLVNQLGGLYHAGVLADVLKHQLSIVHPPAKVISALGKCTTREAQMHRLSMHRIDKLKEIVVSLQSAERLKAPEFVEDIAQILWNNVMPLLHPRYYKEIDVVLNASANALSKINSNRTLLRVHIHLESAKSQLHSELLNNAQDEVRKAFLLDYTLADRFLPEELREILNSEEIERVIHGTEKLEVVEVSRPLDVQLLPLKKKLQLRQDSFYVPTTKEEEALIKIERIKDAKHASRSERANMIEQVIEILNKASETKDADIKEGKEKAADDEKDGDDGNDANGNEEGNSSPSVDSKAAAELEMMRAHLWFEVADMAIRNKLFDLAHTAAEKALGFEWDVKRPCHRHLLLEQAESHVILAKCCAAHIQTLGHVPGEIEDDNENALLQSEDVPEKLPRWYGIRKPKPLEVVPLARIFQKIVLKSLVKSQEIGLTIREKLIPVNALIHMWNMHTSALAEQSRAIATNEVDADDGGEAKEDEEKDDDNDKPQDEGGDEHSSSEHVPPPICHSFFLALESVQKKLWPSSAAGEGNGWAPDMDEDTVQLLLKTATVVSRYLEKESKMDRCKSLVQGTLSAISSQPGSIDYAGPLLQSLARASQGTEPSPMPENDFAKCVIWLEMCRLETLDEAKKLDLIKKTHSTLLEASKKLESKRKEEEDAAAAGEGKDDDKQSPFELPGLKNSPDMNVEQYTTLWAQLAVLSEKLGQKQMVAIAAEKASEEFQKLFSNADLMAGSPLPLAKLNAISSQRWHWVTKSECAYGLSILKQIDPKTQDRQVQDNLRIIAIDKFMRATFYATRCALHMVKDRKMNPVIRKMLGEGGHILHTIKHFWNATLPFVNEKVTRRLIMKPTLVIQKQISLFIQALSHYVANPKLYVKPALRVEIGCLLLECVFDQEEWKMGVDLSAMMLRELPQSLAKPIWKARVLFLLKLGQDVERDIVNIGQDSGDVSLRAGLYSSLAKASANKEQQFEFYQKALETIGETGNPLDSVDMLVEFAEWVYSNNLGRRTTQDQLLTAADLLLDADDSLAEFENEGKSKNASIRSRTSKGSSRGSSRGSRGSAASQSMQKMFGSKASDQKSRRTRSSSNISSKMSRASKKGPQVKMPSTITIGQMANLVRIYCMLATIASNKQHSLRLALVAHSFVEKIWKVSVQSVNLEVEWKRKMAAAAAAAAAEEKKDDEKDNADSNKDGVPAAGPISWSTPSMPDAWIHWHLDEKLRQAFRSCSFEGMVPNKKSVNNPESLVYYLKWLHKIMLDRGYVLQSLPVLALLELLSLDVSCNSELTVLARLLRAQVFEILHLPSKAKECCVSAEPVLPYKERFVLNNERVEQRETLNELIMKQPDISKGSGTNHTATSKQGCIGTGKLSDNFPLTPILKRERMILKRNESQGIWIEVGYQLLRRGRIREAVRLLNLAKRHAEAFQDTTVLIEHRAIMAIVHMMAGNHEFAVKLVQQVQSMEGNSDWWMKVVLILSSVYLGFAFPILPDMVGLDNPFILHPHQTPDLHTSSSSPTAGHGADGHENSNSGDKNTISMSENSKDLKGQAIQVLRNSIRLFVALSQGEARNTAGADYLQKAAILQRILGEVVTMPSPFSFSSTKLLSQPSKMIARVSQFMLAFQMLIESSITTEMLFDHQNTILLLRSLAHVLRKAYLSPNEIPAIHDTLRRVLRNKPHLNPSKFPILKLIQSVPEDADTVHLTIAQLVLRHAETMAMQAMQTVLPSYTPPSMSLPMARQLQDIKLELLHITTLLNMETHWLTIEANPVDADINSAGDEKTVINALLTKHSRYFKEKHVGVPPIQTGIMMVHTATEAKNLYTSGVIKPRQSRSMCYMGSGYVQIAMEIMLDFNDGKEADDQLGIWVSLPESYNTTVQEPKNKVESKGGEGDGPTSVEGGDQEEEASKQEEKKDEKDNNQVFPDEEEEKAKQARRQLLTLQRNVCDEVIMNGNKALHWFCLAIESGLESDSMQVVKEVSLQAMCIVGKWQPLLTAKLMHLYQSAKLRIHANGLFVQSVGAKNPQRLALSRLENLQLSESQHVSPEETNKLLLYLEQKSNAYRRTDLRVAARDGNAEAEAKEASPEEEGEEENSSAGSSMATPYAEESIQLYQKDWGQMLDKLLSASSSKKVAYISLTYVPEHHCLYGFLTTNGHQSNDDGNDPVDEAEAGQQAPQFQVARQVFTRRQEDEFRQLQLRHHKWKNVLKRQICTYGDSERQELKQSEAELSATVTRFSALVSPLLSGLGVTTTTTNGTCEEVEDSKQSSGGQNVVEKKWADDKDVILVLDTSLFELPWEGLECFKGANSLSRSFSLAMTYHQLISSEKQAENNAGAKQPIGYVVDPEDPTEEKQLSHSFKESIAAESDKWKGVLAGDNDDTVVVSDGEWQQLLLDANAFYFAGFGRIMSHISSLYVAPLDLSQIRFTVINDKCSVEASNRVQSKLDNQKTELQLQFESVYNTALLWSLCGVNTVTINQYAISVESSVVYQKKMLKDLVSGQGLASCITAWRSDNSDADSKDQGKEEAKEIKEGEQLGKQKEIGRIRRRLYDRLNPIMCGVIGAKL
eukprot:jgi/Bigna1/83502/fgenesh1_pg.109_\